MLQRAFFILRFIITKWRPAVTTFCSTSSSVVKRSCKAFLMIRLLTEEPNGNEKWWIFWKPTSLLKTSLSGEYTNSGDDGTWEIGLATRLSLSLLSIFLSSRSDEDKLRNKMCASGFLYPSYSLCQKNITILSFNVLW